MLALATIFISLLPLPPNDLWWHMAAGRAMVREGALITTNRWAYTIPADTPYVYQSWLSEIVMYGLWWLGDVPMLTLGRTLAIVGSYGLLAWHAWRRSQNGRAVAAALLLAVLIGWNNWTLRPQTLALLPGAAFAVVLGEWLDGRWGWRSLVALPLLMVVWVNMHGSFVLGIGLLGLAWLAAAIDFLGADRGRRAEAWQRTRSLTIVGGATLLAALCQPLGIGIVGYLRTMLGNAALQQWFVEWQPPDNGFNLLNTGFWFFAVLLLLAALMALGRRRPGLTYVLWYCALAWLTIDGVRYAIWFGLLILPLLADQLASLARSRRPIPTGRAFNRLYLSVVALSLVAVLPWFQPARFLGDDAAHLFADAGPYQRLLGDTTPVAVSEWLAAHPQPGRFWIDQNYSSYTMWRLPELRVFADLRVELFPISVWEDYFAISRGNANSLAVLDRWKIDNLLLARGGNEALYTLLLQTPGWCEPYRDARSAVLTRCS